MTDLDRDAKVLECQSLLPNMLLLEGPLEPLYHIYQRNGKELEMIRTSLGFISKQGHRDVAEKLVLMYLTEHGMEYLRILSKQMGNCLASRPDALQTLRRSRGYLPASLMPLGKILSQFEWRSRVHQLLINSWILPYLCTQHQEKREFILSLGDLSQEDSRRYCNRLVKRFLNGSYKNISPDCCELQRTDSCTERRHLLRSTSSMRQRELGGSDSKPPSPVVAALPSERSKQCCPNHHSHHAALGRWISEHTDQFKTWTETSEFPRKDKEYYASLYSQLAINSLPKWSGRRASQVEPTSSSVKPMSVTGQIN